MKRKFDRLSLAYKLGATFDYQQATIASHSRYRKIVKARQIGMTTALAIEALVDSILHDNRVTIIVSPSARQSQRMMRYIKKAFIKLEREFKITIPVQKWTNEEVYFHHQSEIHSLPNNPKAIQGFDCDSGIIDEAGLFSATEGEEIIDALVGSLAAKQGRLTVSGRPRGKRGLLWNYFDPINPRGKEFEAFKIDWKCRGRLDPKYHAEVLKHQKILTKLQFDEIYGALFVDEGVLIFPHSMLESAQLMFINEEFLIMSPEGTPQDDNKRRFMGVDFGRKRNLTEIHILEEENDKLLRTLMTKSLKSMNFEKQKEIIDDIIGRFKLTKIKIDEKGMGLALLDYFQKKWGERKVEPLKLTNAKTKEKVILQLRDAFADLRLAIPTEEKLYDQLHSYQREYTEHGNVRYFGKVDDTDFQDDTVIALAAAIDAAQGVDFAFGVV